MPIVCWKMFRISALVLVLAALWTPPARADTFIATWLFDSSGDPAPSPFYDCWGWSANGLHCSWLWDQGLSVSAGSGALEIYAGPNPAYDAYGKVISEEESIFDIKAECLAGFDPCFETFTPRMVDLQTFGDPVGVFIRSSKGGGISVIDPSGPLFLSGDKWTDITSLELGLFCPGEDPCSAEWFDLYSVTFDATPIPEPVTPLLVGAGLFAALRRRRPR